MNRDNLFRNFLFLSTLCFVYIISNTILYFNNELFHLYMSWNLFLAWVPLGLSILIFYINLNKKISLGIKILLTLILGGLWLLFYPNSPYIITDFIHIDGNFQVLRDVVNDIGVKERIYVFNDDFSIWLEFAGIAIGVFLGFISGAMSLFLNEENLRRKYGKVFSSIFVIIINFLTGYAITIGRFERWNSWDVFNIKNIITIIKNHWNIPSLKFTLLFFVLSLSSYLALSFMIRGFLSGQKNKS